MQSCFCSMMSLNKQIFWTRLLHLTVFLVKQYSSFTYVTIMSFCQVNWAIPFVDFRGPFRVGKFYINISCIWGLIFNNFNPKLCSLYTIFSSILMISSILSKLKSVSLLENGKCKEREGNFQFFPQRQMELKRGSNLQ